MRGAEAEREGQSQEGGASSQPQEGGGDTWQCGAWAGAALGPALVLSTGCSGSEHFCQ